MKITTAQRNLAIIGGPTKKRVESIATVLRVSGLLPKGGRGPHAPDATADQVALFTLAVAGADRIADAAKVALSLADLVDRNGVKLADVVTAAIGCSEEAATIRHIRVSPALPMAEVTYRREGQADTIERYFAPALWVSPGFKPEAQGQAYVGPIGHIGGAALVQMANDYAASMGAGWIEGN